MNVDTPKLYRQEILANHRPDVRAMVTVVQSEGQKFVRVLLNKTVVSNERIPHLYVDLDLSLKEVQELSEALLKAANRI